MLSKLENPGSPDGPSIYDVVSWSQTAIKHQDCYVLFIFDQYQNKIDILSKSNPMA